MSRIFTSEITTRQTLACKLLEAAIVQGKAAHAYLFTGRSNDDKWLLAQQLACYLNCKIENSSENGSCLVQKETIEKYCQNCRWILQDAHPQAWLKLEGQETKTGRISVEKARLLSQELSKTSNFVRVVIIPQAQQDIFHRPSANALLKTIEEPGANTIFILFASHEETVLPTIVSRCQIVSVPKSQSSGFWLSCEMDKPDTAKRINELKSQLKQDENKEYDFTTVHSATSTLASTLAWAKHLEKQSDEFFASSLILDLIVASEVALLKLSASTDPKATAYLQSLLELAESTKSQIEHYVQSKSALESFALACWELCHNKLSAIATKN